MNLHGYELNVHLPVPQVPDGYRYDRDRFLFERAHACALAQAIEVYQNEEASSAKAQEIMEFMANTWLPQATDAIFNHWQTCERPEKQRWLEEGF